MKKLMIAALALALSGCLWPAPVPRHHPHEPEPEHHPGPEPKQEEPEPPPPPGGEVPEHTRVEAPPAEPAPPADPPPAPENAPSLNIRVVPGESRPGKVIELHLDPPVGPHVKVFWENQVIPKETVGTNGAVIKVRIPGDAPGNGKFHLEWKGKRYSSPVVKVRK